MDWRIFGYIAIGIVYFVVVLVLWKTAAELIRDLKNR